MGRFPHTHRPTDTRMDGALPTPAKELQVVLETILDLFVVPEYASADRPKSDDGSGGESRTSQFLLQVLQQCWQRRITANGAVRPTCYHGVGWR
jgi:hypothetical protein